MSEVLSSGAIVLDTEADIDTARLLALRGRLSIEISTGLKFSRGMTTLQFVERITGLKTRDKRKALEHVDGIIAERFAERGLAYAPKPVAAKGSR